MVTYLIIFLTIFSIHGGCASNTTLQLPLTINPLLQNAIQRSSLTDSIIQTDTTFYEYLSFNDIVKNLQLSPYPQQLKALQSLLVLGLAAKTNGLTIDQFEFLQTSKWTITMSAEELANVSNGITLPLNDTQLFITIQEAMYQILEKKFNFKTEEIAEHLNTTKDEVYAFLEPGWIKVVNFITAKNVLALSQNYTIPPFYIAEALNMSLPELYNSTLPQLEDILVNKIDIIKAYFTLLQLPLTINPLLQNAIQRSSFTDSIIQTDKTFFEYLSFSDIIKNLDIDPVLQQKKDLQGLIIAGLAAKSNGLTVDQFGFLQTSKWTITMSAEELANVSNNITLPLNDELSLITIQEAMYKILEKRFNFKTEEIAEHLNTTKDEVYAFLEPGWIKVVNFITAKNVLALSRNYTISPFYIAEALDMSLPELYNSTLPQLEDILVNKINIIKGLSRLLSTIPTTVGTTSTVAIQPTFITQTKMKTSSVFNRISSQKEMYYTSIKRFTTTLVSSSSNSESSMMDKLVNSKSSPKLLQKTSSKMLDTSSNMIKISSTKKHMTTNEILPTSSIVPQLSSKIGAFSYTMRTSHNPNSTKSMVNIVQTPSLDTTLFSYDMSETIDAKISSSMMDISSVTATSSYPSDVITSSQFLQHPQTSSSPAHSTYFVLSASAKTKEVSTNSRYQHSTVILKGSTRFTSTATDGLLSKTIILVKSSSYHPISSMLHAKDNTPNATYGRSEDDVDTVVLILIPIICILLLAAISFYICYVDRTKRTPEER